MSWVRLFWIYCVYLIFAYLGASAGAGSGEFDIYRGCRRRQIIREAYLNRMAKEQEAKEEWEAKVENNRIKSENQAAKKRKKRFVELIIEL